MTDVASSGDTAFVLLTYKVEGADDLFIRLPADLPIDLSPFLGCLRTDGGPAQADLVLSRSGFDRFNLHAGEEALAEAAVLGDAASAALAWLGAEVVRRAQHIAAVIHAASFVVGEAAVLLPGASRSGKSTLSCRLVDLGLGYTGDDIVLVHAGARVTGVPRPMMLREDVWGGVSAYPVTGTPLAMTGQRRLISPAPPQSRQRTCHLLVFPQRAELAGAHLEPVSAARAAMLLMGLNYGAGDGASADMDALVALARSAPAVRLTYRDMKDIGPEIARFLTEAGAGVTRERLAGLINETNRLCAERHMGRARQTPVAPLRSDRKMSPRLTIGMATFDDYDGVYFTVQALRMYHAEALRDAELIVLDNNPAGPAAPHLKALETHIPNLRYIPFDGTVGSAAAKGQIVAEAQGEYVLILDCHVLLVPGALERLMAYFEAHPETNDLLQGPLISDDLKGLGTHWGNGWGTGLHGKWGSDPRAEDIDAEPFEIGMQGMGLFAFRKAAWPGFHPRFRGFGAEEGYIQEKFRRRGGKALCLPFLRWLHRFARPNGARYPNRWDDRVRNYLLTYAEFGQSAAGMKMHYEGLIGIENFSRMLAGVLDELELEIDPATGIPHPRAGAAHETGAKSEPAPASVPAAPFMPRVLAFTCTRDRPLMVRHAVMQMQRQTYPVDHVIYINAAFPPGQAQPNANYEQLIRDAGAMFPERVAVLKGPTLTHHQNYMTAINAVDANQYDIFLQVDDDDLYLANYVQGVVDSYRTDKWDYSGTASNGLLRSTVWIEDMMLAGVGFEPEDIALGVPEIIPPSLALSRRAVLALKQMPDSGVYHDVQWRRYIARLGMARQVRTDRNFIYHVHGKNVSTGHWLDNDP